MDVKALDLEPGGDRGVDGLDRIVLVEAELGAAVAGPDRLVCLRLDPRRDTDENAADTRGGSPAGLVRCVEDHERAGRCCRGELLVGLVVPVHEQALPGDARPLREGELAERRDVRAESLLGEQSHQRDVRERLRPVDDERLGNGAPEHPCALAQRVLGVDHERRPELRREVGHAPSIELQHTRSDPGSAGEQC